MVDHVDYARLQVGSDVISELGGTSDLTDGKQILCIIFSQVLTAYL